MIIVLKFAFILLPPALVSGPFLADLFVSILAIFFLYESITKKLWHYYKHPFVYLFIFFYLYIVIRSITSSNSLLSLESSLFYCRYLFFALAISLLLERYPRIHHQFCIVLIATLIIVVVDAYIQYFTGINIFGWEMQDSHRLSGMFRDEYVLGSYLSRMLPLGFALLAMYSNLSRWIMISAMVFLILVDVLIYLSGERAAFFYLTLSTLIIVLLMKKFRYLRLITFVISIAIVFWITFAIPEVKERMIDHTISQMGLEQNDGSDSKNLQEKFIQRDVFIFSTQHQALYFSAFKMFKDNIFFGQGPKLFRILCKEERYKSFIPGSPACSTHPHHTYMQLLAETGLVGTIPVIILLFYILYIFYRQGIRMYIFTKKPAYISDAKVLLYTAALVSLWPLTPSGSFFGNWVTVIYFLPVGFLINRSIKL